MRLVQATADDNQRLIDYYGKNFFPGPVTLALKRREDFFSPYRSFSDEHVSYLLLNDENQIEAVASLTVREGFILGERQKIGFANDLQVSPTRRAILNWAQSFMPILEKECQTRNVKYVFSTLAQSQRQAYNAFIRPRSPRRKMPRYHLYRKFDLITLHGRLPFSPAPLNTLTLRNATSQDHSLLAQYVVKKKTRMPIHFCEDDQRFFNSIFRWDHLSLEDFILALDSKGNLVGCVAPWSSRHLVEVSAQEFSHRGLTFKETLRFLSWIRMARAMGSGPLHFLYLTHFLADNPDIFYSLLVEVYRRTSRQEFLVYTHYDGHLQTKPPRSFITAQVPFGLYCLLPPEQAMPDFLKPQLLAEPPDFEMVLF